MRALPQILMVWAGLLAACSQSNFAGDAGKKHSPAVSPTPLATPAPTPSPVVDLGNNAGPEAPAVDDEGLKVKFIKGTFAADGNWQFCLLASQGKVILKRIPGARFRGVAAVKLTTTQADGKVNE